MSLNTNSINPALWKPNNLIMGADRLLFIILAIVTAVLIFALRNWITYICGPMIFYTILKILQKLAAKDALYLKVVWRHLKQEKYYPAGGFYPGYSVVVQYYFDPKIGSRTAGFSIFWSIFYFIFRNSDKTPKQNVSEK
jgi:type IV secretory pathway TrbD component